MVNVLVTSDSVDFADFKVVNTITGISRVSNIDTIVLGKTIDSVSTIITYLEEAEFNKLIYVVDEGVAEDAIEVIVFGMGGRVVKDPFYLETNESLLSLINNVESTSAVELAANMRVLEEFTKRINSGEVEFNQRYLGVVAGASQKTMVQNKELDRVIRRTAATSVGELSKMGSQIQKSNKAIRETESILEEIRANQLERPKPVQSSGVSHYPVLRYGKTKKGVVVKEIGSVPFLHSFMLGLLGYLKTVRGFKPRMIVVLPPGDLYEEMYNFPSDQKNSLGHSWTFINPGNSSRLSHYNAEVVYINHPTHTVMDKLFETEKFDSFLILDMTKGSSEPIVQNKHGSVHLSNFYAIQGLRLAKKFDNVNIKTSFTSQIEVEGAMFSIPFIKEIETTSSKARRRSEYREKCMDMYTELTKGMR